MPFRPSLPRLSHKVSSSSSRWLARQFKDPIVKQRLSSPEGFRSRSAFKLLALDNSWKFLQHPDVHTVVDLGAAPGGWSQVVSGKFGWKAENIQGMGRSVEATKSNRTKIKEAENAAMKAGFGLKQDKRLSKYPSWSTEESSDPLDELGLDDPSETELVKVVQKGRGTIIAVDLLPIYPIPGVQTLQMDFLAPDATDYISALLPPESNGKVDVILSDMAANFTGNQTHDVEACLDLCHAAFEFTRRHLRTAADTGRTYGGVLV